jgi:hypothetical protein
VIDAGVPVYRFAATEKVFTNATVHPDNWCFCSGGVCNPSGVGNASTCRFGAPLFISYPHYYLADPYYIDQVEGLRPEKDLHQFYVDLEPVSLFGFFLFHFVFIKTFSMYHLIMTGNGSANISESSLANQFSY